MTSRPFRRPGALAVLACLLVGPAFALTLDFPGPATMTVSRSDALSSYALPIAPWAATGGLPTRMVEGSVERTAWRIEMPGLTTLQFLAPLRDQLTAAGFAILWECDTRACGGFDFRFAAEVLAEPDMHVDLGDFRFLVAERPAADASAPGLTEVVSLLVSRSADAGFVQMIRVGPPAPLPWQDPAETAPAPATTPAAPVDFAAALETSGTVALDDLAFETGSAVLGAADFPSLHALSAYLIAHPDRKVTLVGHTDAAGSLDANVALSKARAASVRDRLISAFGVLPSQLSAEGVGFLAPRASNLTEEGRTRNRRVEAMLTSTQ